MGASIALIVILLLAVLAGSIAGVVALAKLSNLKQQVAELKEQLQSVISSPSLRTLSSSENVEIKTEHTNRKAQQAQSSDQTSSVLSKTSIDANKTNHTQPIKTQTKKITKPSAVSVLVNKLKDQFLENWMTWIGGVALAFGGIFLAKYSLDSGLLSASLRLVLGGLFGVGLIALAEYLHRKGIVFEGFNNYIPAALAGGGFISCFALTLLAYSSYQILSPALAFVMLSVISLAASSMALRLGPLLAVLGIVSAYSVPLWVNTGSGYLVALLTYISFITLSGVLVAKKVKRNWLWYLLWAGHIGWYWLLLNAADTQQYWLMGIFALLSIVGLIAMMRLGVKLTLLEYRPHSIKRLCKLIPDHPLLLALVLPLLLMMLITLPTMQWQITALCLIVLLLFLVLQNSRWDLWQGLALLIAVVLIFSQQRAINTDEHLFVFTGVYGLGLLLGVAFCAYGLYFGARYYKRLAFHLLAALSIFVLIATLYVIIPVVGLSIAYPVWVVILLLTSAVLIKLAQKARSQWQQFSYWIGANANLTLCLTMILDNSGLTLALAVQVLLISYLVKRHQVPMPHWPIKALVAAVLARLTFAPWIPSYVDLTIFSLHWSLIVYPVALVLFWLAAKQWQQTNMKIWLEGATLHCLALFVTTETSYQLVGHYPQLTNFSFYEQVLLSCNWLALGCVYLHRSQSAGQLGKLYKVAGLLLAGLAGLLLFNTTIDKNPLLERLYIGEIPLFNWLLLTWLVPSVLIVWLANFIKPINKTLSQVLLGGAGLLAVLAINSLIRQYWQSGFIHLSKPTSDAELYSYSIIWLLLGALVVIAGHLKQQLLLQKIGLGILGAVIVKVFLIDMASLTGLLKAVSFIGLGLSLVALSWLFQKLRSKAEAT